MARRGFTSFLNRDWWVRMSLPLSVLVLSLVSFQFHWQEELALRGGAAELLARPWTLLSYSWLHLSALHLLSSLAFLSLLVYVSLGKLSVLEVWGVYLASVVVGGVAFVSFSEVVGGATDTLSGSSAGISGMALYILFVICYDRYWRGDRFLFFLLLLGGFSLFLMMDVTTSSVDNLPGGVAHAMGAFLGFWLGVWRSYKRTLWQKRNDQKLRSDLLHKAKVSGYASLSEEERRLLVALTQKTNYQ